MSRAVEVMDLRPQPQPPVIVVEKPLAPPPRGVAVAERVRTVAANIIAAMTQATIGAVRATGAGAVRGGTVIAHGTATAVRTTRTMMRGARAFILARGAASIAWTRRAVTSSRTAGIRAAAGAASSGAAGAAAGAAAATWRSLRRCASAARVATSSTWAASTRFARHAATSARDAGIATVRIGARAVSSTGATARVVTAAAVRSTARGASTVNATIIVIAAASGRGASAAGAALARASRQTGAALGRKSLQSRILLRRLGRWTGHIVPRVHIRLRRDRRNAGLILRIALRRQPSRISSPRHHRSAIHRA